MTDEKLLFQIAEFFKVFGDASRVKLLYMLHEREMSVGDMAEESGMSQSAVSHQMRILRQADLVKSRRDGKNIYYSLDDSHVEMFLSQCLEHILHKRGEQ